MQNPNLVRHVLSVEAVMKALARRLDEDEELWGLTGLLHDLDVDETVDDFPRHGYITGDLLKDELPPESLHAIVAHPGHEPAENRFDWALYCADPITGLITAAVLMHPSHKLSELKVKSVKKRFKDKRFAAGANREAIKCCEKIGIELEEFLELSLKAMRDISDELGF